MNEKVIVVVAWHNPEQREKFMAAWECGSDDRVLFQQDANKEGCGATKNKGIQAAINGGAKVIVILDDDVFPSESCKTLDGLIHGHLHSLKPKLVNRFRAITIPSSRGTPYFNRTIEMPVAASFGWWENIPDRDAVRQLADGEYAPMQFHKQTIFGDYFAGSGMNVAFNAMWFSDFKFIPVSRWDDIWGFWILQRIAYDRGYCFSFEGPTCVHSRQSDVFSNLQDEAKYLRENETLWQKIATHPQGDYDSLRALLPV